MPRFAASDPRRIRVKKPKVKTGCITCKIRRVKCDEAKPSCLRCIKFGAKCDGYSKDIERSSRNRPAVVSTKSPTLVVPHDPQILRAPHRSRFKTEEEHRYFQVFVQKTAPCLAGFYDSELWCRLVLQACESQASVRSAAIAIGALDQTLDAAQTALCRPSFDFIDTRFGHLTDTYQYALQQYGNAVEMMREEACAGQPDLRTTLISCLLVVCFELFHGNHISALNQAASGLNLLIRAPRQQDCQEIIPAECAQQSIPLSEADMIEDALVQTFVRLDFQTLSFMDEESIKDHNLNYLAAYRNYQHIPSRFRSLSEARSYWELSLRPIMHYMTIGQSYEHYKQTSFDPAVEKVDNWTDRLLKVISASKRPLVEPLSCPFAWPPLCLKRNFLHGGALERDHQRVEKWASAFAPLFEYSRTLEGSADFVKASILQLRYKTTIIALSSSPFKGELQYDNFTNLFEEVVELCEIIINHTDSQRRDNKAIFTLDNYIVAPLSIVAMKCRIASIRRQAISLLLTRPRRESIWDSVVAGKFVSVVMELEEEGLGENEFIPGERRVNALGMSFDLLERRGLLQYTRGYCDLVYDVDITW